MVLRDVVSLTTHRISSSRLIKTQNREYRNEDMGMWMRSMLKDEWVGKVSKLGENAGKGMGG